MSQCTQLLPSFHFLHNRTSSSVALCRTVNLRYHLKLMSQFNNSIKSLPAMCAVFMLWGGTVTPKAYLPAVEEPIILPALWRLSLSKVHQ